MRVYASVCVCEWTQYSLPDDGVLGRLVLGLALHADHLDSARVEGRRDPNLKHAPRRQCSLWMECVKPLGHSVRHIVARVENDKALRLVSDFH